MFPFEECTSYCKLADRLRSKEPIVFKETSGVPSEYEGMIR